MAKVARDVMTANPACCTPNTTIVQVAKMMLQNDCGQIPVVDTRGLRGHHRPGRCGMDRTRARSCRIGARGVSRQQGGGSMNSDC
jgi:CBS domain-containing protein